MAQSLVELIEQFCRFQRKQKGKTEEGVETYRRWLEYFLTYVRSKEGRLARVTDLNAARIQAWMDDMAANDLATSTISGMRRGSVASLRVRHLNGDWGLYGVRVKGGKSRDIPLPRPVMTYLHEFVAKVLPKRVERVTPDTPRFWSTWGRRAIGKTAAPMTGKNIWRLCKTYGRLIGVPELKSHDLRHGVAMEVLE